jgi:hypothetical protein
MVEQMKIETPILTFIAIVVGVYTLNEFSYNSDLKENKYLAMVKHPYFYIKNKGQYSIKELGK